MPFPKPFRCHECLDRGLVVPTQTRGRSIEVERDRYLELPERVEILTCNHCGEEYWGPGDIERIVNAVLMG